MSHAGLLELSSDLDTICYPNGSCTVSWGKAPSLNLTDVEPDVQYIVEIRTMCNDVLQRNSTNFLKYEFPNPHPRFPYEIVVTPRSNVKDAMDGRNETQTSWSL